MYTLTFRCLQTYTCLINMYICMCSQGVERVNVCIHVCVCFLLHIYAYYVYTSRYYGCLVYIYIY